MRKIIYVFCYTVLCMMDLLLYVLSIMHFVESLNDPILSGKTGQTEFCGLKILALNFLIAAVILTIILIVLLVVKIKRRQKSNEK